jgi:(2Fe-2S) ferredoxin
MAKEAHKGKGLTEIAPLYGIGQYEAHIFLCTGPNCCAGEVGQSAWDALKAKLKALYPVQREAKIYRTRVNCLRMCQDGPIAVCYPQGHWFRGVTADRVDALVEHLRSGGGPHPLRFVSNPLPKA